MWSPPSRIAERLLNSYKLEMLDGTPLDGLYHARRLRSFAPREGTLLAAEQKKLEEALASSKPKGSEDARPEEAVQTDIEQEESEQEDSEARSLEEEYEEGQNEDDEGFFYDNMEEMLPEEEEMGIGARVAERRRGCLHNGGGQME